MNQENDNKVVDAAAEMQEDATQKSQEENQSAGRTFTQDEVNDIVRDRLAREKAKFERESSYNQREQEIAKRELKITAKELLSEMGLPLKLADVLECTGKEQLESSINALSEIFKEHAAAIRVANAPTGVTPAFGSTGTTRTNEDTLLRRAMGLKE